MQFQPVYPVPFVHTQPRPRFCIFRPGGLLAPLIPIDELPSWLQVCNWSPEMFMGLQPVSLSYIPREGEYDVICHHCSSSVDSLHQSISERNEESQSSPSSASQPKSCPGAFFNPLPAGFGVSSVAKIPMGFPFPMLGQPQFSATLQSPLLGVYGVNFPTMPDQMASPAAPPQKSPTIPRSSSSTSENALPGLRESSEQAPAKVSDTPATSVHSIISSCSQKDPIESLSPNIVAGIAGELGEAAGNLMTPNEQSDIKVAAAIAKSLCSVDDKSVASAISLTAAVERLRDRMNAKYPVGQRPFINKDIKPRLRRRSSYDACISVPGSKPQSRTSSLRIGKGRKVPSPAHRRAKIRRRRRANKMSPRLNPKRTPSNRSTASTHSAPKLEQPNSATKRRDRRERLAQLLVHGKKDTDPKSPYWHMMMIPNWSE